MNKSNSTSTGTVENPDRTLRFAMLGLHPSSSNPYFWSAIINGYDKEAMANSLFPNLAGYLNAEPPGSIGVSGAKVTHVWTDDPKDAPVMAKAALIPHVVKHPEEVIGQVDAVFIATDDGFDHVRRARPFIEAGLPVFVEKPLALGVPDLQTFLKWKQAGARILSCSRYRYTLDLSSLLADRATFGEPRWISFQMLKTWEDYGIHAFEAIFRLLGPGFTSVRLESQPKLEVAHIVHRSGAQINIAMIYDNLTTYGTIHVVGTTGQIMTRLPVTAYYAALRLQVMAFVDFVRAGGPDPYPFSDTVEMMAVLIAGLRSRAEGNRRVEVAEILGEISSK